MRDSISYHSFQQKIYLGEKSVEEKELKSYEKNVEKLSKSCLDRLLLKRKVREPSAIIAEGDRLFKMGEINACKSIMDFIETNPKRSMDFARKKIRFYSKDVKTFSTKTVGQAKTFSSERAGDYLKKRYLYGEEVGSKQFLKRLGKIQNRDTCLGEGHLLIIDLNNKFVDEYKEGNKIDTGYFTEKYMDNPAMYFQ
jgi:hypothetical protein